MTPRFFLDELGTSTRVYLEVDRNSNPLISRDAKLILDTLGNRNCPDKQSTTFIAYLFDARYNPTFLFVLLTRLGFIQDVDEKSVWLLQAPLALRRNAIQLRNYHWYKNAQGESIRVACTHPGTEFPYSRIDDPDDPLRFMEDGRYIDRDSPMSVLNLIEDLNCDSDTPPD